jgi:hypothetical protein
MTKTNMTKRENVNYEKLCELIAEEGVDGMLHMLSRFVDTEAEMSDAPFGHAWPTEMFEIGRALRALASRSRKSVALLSDVVAPMTLPEGSQVAADAPTAAPSEELAAPQSNRLGGPSMSRPLEYKCVECGRDVPGADGSNPGSIFCKAHARPAPKTTYRVEFTVERRGNPTRKSIEGTNLDKLLARVEKLDGYNVVQSFEVSR